MSKNTGKLWEKKVILEGELHYWSCGEHGNQYYIEDKGRAFNVNRTLDLKNGKRVCITIEAVE